MKSPVFGGDFDLVKERGDEKIPLWAFFFSLETGDLGI